jgi:hypothetical protein
MEDDSGPDEYSRLSRVNKMARRVCNSGRVPGLVQVAESDVVRQKGGLGVVLLREAVPW